MLTDPGFSLASQHSTWALNPTSSLNYTISNSIPLFCQNIHMVSYPPPFEILSRSFRLSSISLLHCLEKTFPRVVSFHCSHFIFHSLREAQSQAFISLTLLRLLSSKDVLISPRTSSTWPSPMLIPSPPLTWPSSCLWHSSILLPSWNISIWLWEQCSLLVFLLPPCPLFLNFFC